MVKLKIKIHPPILFSYTFNQVSLFLTVEYPKVGKRQDPIWLEADISVPKELSLLPETDIQKGRIRIGILKGGEYIKKAVKIYANQYTPPKIYTGKLILFVYDKNGIVVKRLEKDFQIRCERKKPEVL